MNIDVSCGVLCRRRPRLGLLLQASSGTVASSGTKLTSPYPVSRRAQPGTPLPHQVRGMSWPLGRFLHTFNAGYTAPGMRCKDGPARTPVGAAKWPAAPNHHALRHPSRRFPPHAHMLAYPSMCWSLWRYRVRNFLSALDLHLPGCQSATNTWQAPRPSSSRYLTGQFCRN